MYKLFRLLYFVIGFIEGARTNKIIIIIKTSFTNYDYKAVFEKKNT